MKTLRMIRKPFIGIDINEERIVDYRYYIEKRAGFFKWEPVGDPLGWYSLSHAEMIFDLYYKLYSEGASVVKAK